MASMDVDVDTSTNQMEVDSETKTNENDTKVDEALYSRQLYVIDHESMKKMQQSTVLIAGMNGLGVEIAKNTILAGVKSVTIFDNSIIKMNDLSSNFYLTLESVGKQTRAECSITQLKSLNPYVNVNCISGDLKTLIESKKYDVIVLVNYTLKQCINYNQITHNLGLKFISCDTAGVFGQLFVDFGKEFQCTDLTGEPPMQGMVINISKAEKGVVQVHEDSRHGLSDGDFIRFSEVEGMTELNTLPPQPIKVTTPFAFEICDTSSFGEYSGNGLFFQVIQGAKLSFNSLSEILSMKKDELIPKYPNIPKISQTDYGKDQYEQHLFYLALQEYISSNNGKYPLPYIIDDANEIYNIFSKLCIENGIEECKEEEKLSFKKLKYTQLARCSSSVISPMCAFLGGIIGQEVLKGCSHKFTPLQQLMYFDAVECLPLKNINYNEYKGIGYRYDDNIACFGITIQNKILSSKLFLIGAGAIGCEILKNWALMGIGCNKDKNGLIIVTDMDQIETSNLNRQFLFRKSDVGKSKSICASQAVKIMNNDINIIGHSNRVGKDSENVYNYSFWNNLNCVCTALDNVSARLYVDAQCVYYNKPLLESGTLGTKGNTQIIVPKLTESYGSTRDPDEVGVPICTLKNFPNKIEHTIQWARDDFEGEFTQIICEINKYLENGNKYLKELHKNNPAEEEMILRNIGIGLNTIESNKNGKRPLTFEQCVHWARNKFENDFSNRIKQLLYNFPHDAITTEGAKFWSPPKRAPDPIIFDENDILHIEYIISAANLRAKVYGLKGSNNKIEIKKYLSNCIVPKFDINKKIKIATSDEEEKEMKNNNDDDDYGDAEISNLIKLLPDRKTLIGMK
eukprot:170419_1